MTEKTFDEILRDEQAKIREEERSEQERVNEERESVLRRSAALCYDALHRVFSAVDLKDMTSFDSGKQCIDQATGVLGGETNPVVAGESPTTLPFDFEGLPKETQDIIVMIAGEPRRFKKDEIGDQVLLKDTRYGSARAAYRRQQEAERAEEEGSDASSSAPAPPTPVKKAVPAPPRSTPAQKRAASAASPEAVAASALDEQEQATAVSEPATPPSSEEGSPEAPSQPQESAMDKIKGRAKAGLEKLTERNPE